MGKDCCEGKKISLCGKWENGNRTVPTCTRCGFRLVSKEKGGKSAVTGRLLEGEEEPLFIGLIHQKQEKKRVRRGGSAVVAGKIGAIGGTTTSRAKVFFSFWRKRASLFRRGGRPSSGKRGSSGQFREKKKRDPGKGILIAGENRSHYVKEKIEEGIPGGKKVFPAGKTPSRSVKKTLKI